jgi:hypothetical protein
MTDLSHAIYLPFAKLDERKENPSRVIHAIQNAKNPGGNIL